MIGYFKGEVTDYILRYRAGKLVSEGRGIAFFYLEHNTQIVSVPTGSMDANFTFNEITSSFQAVAIQGQFTYRIADPKQAVANLNFTLNPRTKKHTSEDPNRLGERISNLLQMATRGEIRERSLEDAIKQSEAIAGIVLEKARAAGGLEPMGVELMKVYFHWARPTPEVSKALEADYRESLLRKADEAIYARRGAAVEEERKIKERELQTEVSLAERRSNLINLEGENRRKEAEFRAQAVEIEAESKANALKLQMDVWKGSDPRLVLALGVRDLGQNAGKIGNLTITSEVLAEILNANAAKPGS